MPLYAHLADHWPVYLLYAAPMLIVVGAILLQTMRDRGGSDDLDGGQGPEPDDARPDAER